MPEGGGGVLGIGWGLCSENKILCQSAPPLGHALRTKFPFPGIVRNKLSQDRYQDHAVKRAIFMTVLNTRVVNDHRLPFMMTKCLFEQLINNTTQLYCLG